MLVKKSLGSFLRFLYSFGFWKPITGKYIEIFHADISYLCFFFCHLDNEASKKEPPGLPITPTYYHRLLFYNKNGDVGNKLKLNFLRID